MVQQIDIDALEKKLAPLSHGLDALRIWQEVLRALKGTARQEFLSDYLLCAPIYHPEAEKQLKKSLDYFRVLQGDIVRTEAAYVLSVRRDRGASFVIATSTCDAVPKRRETALLLEIEPKRAGYAPPKKIQGDLGNLTLYKTTQHFYLPALPDDDEDVLYNLVHLDSTAQCHNASLEVATRRASMTLLGWRVFGSLLRNIQVREGAGEPELRLAMGPLLSNARRG